MPVQVEYEGVVHEFPDDFSDEDIQAALGGESAPEESPLEFLGAMAGNIPESAGRAVSTTLSGVASLGKGLVTSPLETLGGIIPGIVDHYGSRYGSADARRDTVRNDPVGMVLDMIPVGKGLQAAPAAARAGGRLAKAGAARGAQFVADHPAAVSTVVGAAPGVMAGNPLAAGMGAFYGFDRAPAIGRRFGKMAKALGDDAPAPMRSSPAAPAASGDALVRELLAREPDWRNVDAVPIDAIKRKGIIEAGESRVGLSERMAELLKQKTPDSLAEAERLAKALRQRMHISASR